MKYINKIKNVSIKKVLFLIASVFLVFLVFDYFKTKNEISNLEKKYGSASEIDRIQRKVKKYIDIPSDETPELRIVNDVDILEGQKFFAKAKKGDAVLVYLRYGRGILYRESEDKIVEFAPVNYTE